MMVIVYGIAIKPEKKGSLNSVDEAMVTIEEGLQGDCRGKGGLFRKRQITVISLEQWKEACAELDKDFLWTTRRANVCITGHTFGPNDFGKTINFAGGVELEITGETDPCKRMDEVFQGLHGALMSNWRGGVTCRVLKGGSIKHGEFVEIY